MAALNEHLLAACVANRCRTISGKGMTISQASEHERALLSPLAEEGFPIHEVLYPLIADSKARVKVKTNRYSTPPVARATCDSFGLAVADRDQA